MPKDQQLPTFAAFALEDLEARADRHDDPWFEFLTRDGLEAGLYTLEAGQPDLQSPHERDEVYLVLRGQASFTAGGETVEVGRGSVLFVAAHEEHRFHEISEALRVLVFFGGP